MKPCIDERARLALAAADGLLRRLCSVATYSTVALMDTELAELIGALSDEFAELSALGYLDEPPAGRPAPTRSAQ